jgi:TraM recognition site of TraD and TraG
VRLFGHTALSHGATPYVRNLDTPLLRLSPHGDCMSARDLCNGVHVTGAIGSGKTTGSGKALRGAILRARCGILVNTAKPEEVDLWISEARAHGRAQDIVLFTEGNGKGFNFLDWEFARGGIQSIGNVVEFLMHILDAADHAMDASGETKDPFWPQASRMLLNYSVPLLYCAWGKLTVTDILDFVNSAATKTEQYSDAAFRERSFAARTMAKALKEPAIPLPESELKSLLQYWFDDFPPIPDRTRGSMVITLAAKLDRFKHGRMKSLFCERTTILPEYTFHGAIIIMAMPVLSWKEDGIIGQLLFKYAWQRAVESRNGLDARQRERIVVNYADEAQYFISKHDDAFLSTSRGSRAAVIYLTQSLPTYFARMGRDQADAVKGLIGKFNTNIWHLNSCPETNKYASELIGRDLQRRRTTGRSSGTNTSRGMNEGASENRGKSTSYGSSTGSGHANWNSNSGDNSGDGESWGTNVGRGTNESENWSEAEQMDNVLEPRFFASELLSGGPPNRLVTGVVFRAGARFKASGTNWLIARFRQ